MGSALIRLNEIIPRFAIDGFVEQQDALCPIPVPDVMRSEGKYQSSFPMSGSNAMTRSKIQLVAFPHVPLSIRTQIASRSLPLEQIYRSGCSFGTSEQPCQPEIPCLRIRK